MKKLNRLTDSGVAMRGAGVASLLLFFIGSALGQNSWVINTSFSRNSYDYILSGENNNYSFFNLGGKYTSGNFSASLSLPLVFTGNGMTDTTAGSNSGHMDNNGQADLRPGDIYLYGEYRLYEAGNYSRSIAITTQLKIPTSASLSSEGTGKFDYGAGIVARQIWNGFMFFGEFNYLIIGDPVEVTYDDPFIYGLGAGKFFADGDLSVSLYYRGYTNIVDGVEPPRQLSLGAFIKIMESTTLSLYGIRGFSESSPDLGFTIGLDYSL